MKTRYVGNILLWAGVLEMALGIYGWVLMVTVVAGAVVTAWGAWRERE